MQFQDHLSERLNKLRRTPSNGLTSLADIIQPLVSADSALRTPTDGLHIIYLATSFSIFIFWF